MADISILGISGSLRRESHNSGLLRAAAEEMPEGVALRLYDGLRDVGPSAATRCASSRPR